MKKVMLFTFALMILSSCGFAQKPFEGYWEQTSTTNSTLPMQPKEEAKKQVTYYKSGKMKIQNLSDDKITIFRFDKDLVWEIDLKKNVYTEVTFAEMQAQMNQAKESMKEVQGELDSMSPEERKMMEKFMGKKLNSMLGDQGGMTITAQYTGEKKTINGHKCKRVLYYMNEEPFTTVWLTDKYFMANDFMDVYKKMGMVKGVFSESVRKIKGFPIQTDFSMDLGLGKIETTTLVTKIVIKSLPDNEFSLPKGLKKSKNKMMFQGR